ncbi:MAG: hypothetical protein QNJ09_12060 [Paracoccaceae bacterium]|nr:hypothetical protein [Paracoccaceae bacterium]
MVDIHYQKLFGLRITNSYFPDDVCPALKVRPSKNLSRFAAQSTRFLRQIDGGELYAQLDLEKWRYSGVSPITFELTIQDPEFAIYTDLDLKTKSDAHSTTSPTETILYADNLGIERDGHNRLMLKDKDRPLALPISGAGFYHHLDTPASDPEFVIRRHFSDAEVMSASFEGDVSEVHLDLSALEQGRYRLFEGTQELHDFYLLHRSPASIFGIIDIFPGGPDQDVNEDARVVEDDGTLSKAGSEAGPLEFVLPFEARNAIWRYLISPGKRSGEHTNWKTHVETATHSNDNFNSPEEHGRFWVITSKTELKLEQRPSFHVEIENETTKQRVVLPRPSPSSIRPAKEQGGTTYADIYVAL